jgi:mRNA interferase YafQ
MLPIRPTSQFKKDLKRAKKQKRDIALLRHVLEQLANMQPLPASFSDHRLKGNWRDFRECHLEPD